MSERRPEDKTSVVLIRTRQLRISKCYKRAMKKLFPDKQIKASKQSRTDHIKKMCYQRILPAAAAAIRRETGPL